MDISARPRRSLLYIPASNARAMEKARTLSADGFIIDLEDAVLPEAKTAARAAAIELVKNGGLPGREILVRVNALDTPWAKYDLAALTAVAAPAILLPKVAGPEDLSRVAPLLNAQMRVWAMMETPRAILRAHEIASFGAPLEGFVVGTNDLAKDLRCAHPSDRAPMTTALQLCVLAARAFDLAIIDGVHIDLDDDEGFRDSCRVSRELGFDGRSLIHPKQIAGANAVYAPTADEVAHAGRVVAAHRAAAADGKAVTVVDGKLVEALHVRAAERVLAQAEAIARLNTER